MLFVCRFIFLLIFAFGIAFPYNSRAVICSAQADGFSGSCNDVATNYSMTMKEMRLRKDDGTFVTIASGDQTYNFAAVGANTAVGNYLTNGSVPPGTYTAVSPILDKNITVSGSTQLTGGTTPTCRTGTGDITDGGAAQNETFDLSTAPGITSGTDAVEGQVSDAQYINPAGDFALIDDSISGFPITINESSSLTFTMSIGIAETATYSWSGSGASTCIDSVPGELSVTLSASTS